MIAATSTTIPATTVTSVISGVITVMITGASVLGKMTAKSTLLKKVADVATMKKTTLMH